MRVNKKRKRVFKLEDSAPSFCYSIKTLFSLHMNFGLLLHNMDVALTSKMPL